MEKRHGGTVANAIVAEWQSGRVAHGSNRAVGQRQLSSGTRALAVATQRHSGKCNNGIMASATVAQWQSGTVEQ
eukprot:8900367-Alexandrium_andersonii.AAC.1